MCLPPFSPLIFLLNSFCECFLPVILIQLCSNPSFCSDWSFPFVLFPFYVWIRVMKFLSYRSFFMTVFVAVTIFFKWAWYDSKQKIRPYFWQWLITCKINLYLLFLYIEKFMKWSTLFNNAWGSGAVCVPRGLLCNTWYYVAVCTTIVQPCTTRQKQPK